MKVINILAQAAPAAAPAAPVQDAAPVAAEGNATTVQSTEQGPADAGKQGSPWDMGFTLLLVGVVLYFLIIRPTRKQQKEAKERQESLKVGSKVVTNAGIHGIIRDMQEHTVKLEIAANTVIKLNKNCIVQIMDKSGKTDATATAAK